VLADELLGDVAGRCGPADREVVLVRRAQRDLLAPRGDLPPVGEPYEVPATLIGAGDPADGTFLYGLAGQVHTGFAQHDLRAVWQLGHP
jgi:hypothetical protein